MIPALGSQTSAVSSERADDSSEAGPLEAGHKDGLTPFPTHRRPDGSSSTIRGRSTRSCDIWRRIRKTTPSPITPALGRTIVPKRCLSEGPRADRIGRPAASGAVNTTLAAAKKARSRQAAGASGEEVENGRGSPCLLLASLLVLARCSHWDSRVFQRDNDPQGGTSHAEKIPLLASIALAVSLPCPPHADGGAPPVNVQQAAGTSAAAIQSAVDAYRADLGALNPSVAGSFGSGRREINWDGVPDAFAARTFSRLTSST